MRKNKEIELLIARYRADIAALEDRKYELIRQKDILESLIPTVLVWYMWKVFQSIEIPLNKDVLISPNEVENAKQKLEHLRSLLEELQQAVELIQEEENIMKKRIEELESSFADQPDQHWKETTHTEVAGNENFGMADEKRENEISHLRVGDLKLEDLLKNKDTDWKKVCEELQIKIIELSENLKTNSQQLEESEGLARHLEKEYAMLEQDLQTKIQLLEKKTDTLVLEIDNEERENYLQEDLDNKEALLAMQEALAEVRSLKESLSKSKSSSKGDEKAQETNIEVESAEDEIAPSGVSVSKEAISEPSTAQISVRETKVVPDISKPSAEEKDKRTDDSRLDSVKSTATKSEKKASTEPNFSKTEDRQRISETSVTSRVEAKTVVSFTHPSEKPVSKEITSDKTLKLEELQAEDTDWKRVCEDLLKQVSDLSEKLKNSTQTLLEMESFKKDLETEYAKLKEELQEKIQQLEKRADTLISEITDKEQEKIFQEELESKGALSTIQDALAEVRSMRESLSKSKTLSEVGDIEPLDTVTIGQETQSELHSTKDIDSPSQTTISRHTVPEQSESRLFIKTNQTSDEALPSEVGSVTPHEVISKGDTSGQPQELPLIDQITVSKVKVVPEIGNITPKDLAFDGVAVSPSAEMPGSKYPRNSIHMAKRNEVEMLIARYKADIAALEERKEYLLRQIEVLENLFPTILFWYMMKVFKTIEIPFRQEMAFPQQDIMEEARKKVESYNNNLEELQKAVALINEEESIMMKRIKELESFLADQQDQYPDKDIKVCELKPEKSDIMHGPQTERVLETEDFRPIPKDVVSTEGVHKYTKSVTQISDISVAIAKDKDLLSEVSVSKEAVYQPGKIEKPESKTEVAPEITEVSDEDIAKITSAPSEGTIPKEAVYEPGETELPVSDIFTVPETTEMLAEPVPPTEDKVPSEVSVPKQTVLETADHTAPDAVSDTHAASIIQKISDLAIVSAERLVSPSVVAVLDESVLSQIQIEGKPSDTLTHPAEGKVISPGITVSKETTFEPAEEETIKPSTESLISPEIPQIPDGSGPSAEGITSISTITAPSEVTISKEAPLDITEGEIVEPSIKSQGGIESSKIAAEDIAPAGGLVSISELPVPEEGIAQIPKEVLSGTELEAESTQIPIEPAGTEGVIATPSELIASKETFLEPTEGEIAESSQETEGAPKIPDEAVAGADSVVSPSQHTVPEKDTAETPKDLSILSETEAKQTPAGPAGTEDVTASPTELIDSKEVILESTEGEIAESSKETEGAPKIPDEAIAGTDSVVSPSQHTVPEKDTAETHKDLSVLLETEAKQTPAGPAGTEDVTASPTELIDSKEVILESTEGRIAEPNKETESAPEIPDEAIADTGSVVSPSQHTVPEKDTAETPKDLSETEAKKTPAGPADTEDVIATPSELISSKETTLEHAEYEIIEQGKAPQGTPDITTIPDEVAASPEYSSQSQPPDSKVAETPDDQLVLLEKQLGAGTTQIPAASEGTVFPPGPLTEITTPEKPTDKGILSPSDGRDSKEATSEQVEAQMADTETPQTLIGPIVTADDAVVMPETVVSESAEPQVSLSETPFISEESKVFPEAVATAEDKHRPSDLEVLKEVTSAEHLTSPVIPAEGIISEKPDEFKTELDRLSPMASDKPSRQPEFPAGPTEDLKLGEPSGPDSVAVEESSERKIIPPEMETKPTVTEKLEIEKTAADGIEALALISEPSETTPTETSPRGVPPGVDRRKEGEMPMRKPSGPTLAEQTLQNKLLVKDHLIKSMADQLRQLARNNKWAGSKALEAATGSDPVNTYDFDTNNLLLYLRGEEPHDFAASMKSNNDYTNSNPLNVKVVRKLDRESLLIEWGPPPSVDVVGFQIFVNGQFMYWVHSAKRNMALLQPLNLKVLLEINVSPINIRGDIIFRSSVTYKPQ